MLVRVDKVVIGRVVKEDETKSDGEATHRRASPG